MNFLRFTYLFIALVIVGCSGYESPENALQNELAGQIDDFYSAVKNKNVNRVYDMLADSYQLQFDKDEFPAFFAQNYEIFLEYAAAIRNDSNSFAVQAQPVGDPCGTLTLGFDQNGEWKILQTQDNFVSEEMHKEHLIRLVKSYQFSLALQEYARKHPELSGFQQRAILRTVASGDILPQNVQFTGNQALISMPDEIQILMTCTGKAWRLDQCNSLR